MEAQILNKKNGQKRIDLSCAIYKAIWSYLFWSFDIKRQQASLPVDLIAPTLNHIGFWNKTIIMNMAVIGMWITTLRITNMDRYIRTVFVSTK